MKKINVVKIGGNVIDDPEGLERFLKIFSEIEGPKILVHGGGKEATRLSAAMSIETKMIDGRRVTDRQTLDIVTMVYAGLINKRIVSLLQRLGCNALGMSGADGNLIPARRRSPSPIDYGHVGDIDPHKVNKDLLRVLLEGGITPVVCAICHDTEGNLLNCNADSVAAALAIAASSLGRTVLTYCFEKAGVLADIDDETSVIPLVTPSNFTRLKEEGVIAKGMIPKIANALDSAGKGVAEVRICKAEAAGSDAGTLIIAGE
ncbi:MAG: acetylglutamate kinase [Muribaculaceae bacterium]|nr:acetylglutamate kinase [Muribaculaceae bacterium]